MNNPLSFKLTEDGCLSQEDTKKYYSKFGFACFIFGLATILTELLFVIIIHQFFPDLMNDNLWYAIFSYIPSLISIYLIALPLLIAFLKPLPTARPIKEKMKVSHLICCVCIAFMLTYIGNNISNIFLSLQQLITKTTPENPVAAQLDNSNIILSIIFAGILFPILEEIVFRKIICNKLLPLGEAPTIVISAAFFGAIHGNLHQFAYAFLIGLFFGFIYVKTGRLIYTIILHSTINLFHGVFASYVTSILPIDKINEILSNEELLLDAEKMIAELSPYAYELSLFMLFSYTLLGLTIAGLIISLIAIRKRKIILEKGILPPENKHRFSNFFLTGGVAATIAIIAFQFVVSMLPA